MIRSITVTCQIDPNFKYDNFFYVYLVFYFIHIFLIKLTIDIYGLYCFLCNILGKIKSAAKSALFQNFPHKSGGLRVIPFDSFFLSKTVSRDFQIFRQHVSDFSKAVVTNRK